jgi:flagellar motor switch protein FliM
MAEILSQAEIDDLLNALQSGTAEDPKDEEEDDRQKVRLYDFRTANRFTKDQMRSLGMVFQTYAQLLANRLTSILRLACECKVLSVEEMGYSEFNNSLPSPVVLGLYTARPMEGTQIIQVSPELAYLLINRLLGGMVETKESSKQFTEIELALIGRFLDKLMVTNDEAWEKVLSVRTRLDHLETDPQFAQITGLNDAVAVGTLNVKLGSDEALISMCLPRTSIEGIAEKLTTSSIYSGYGASTEHVRNVRQAQAVENRVSKAEVVMTAYFKDTAATIADIVNLQVGDVIRLEHGIGDPILMNIAHIPKFEGRMGTLGSRYAVRITEILSEEGSGEDELVTG